MAPSSTSIVVAFFALFAVTLLHPSAAARDAKLFKPAAENQQAHEKATTTDAGIPQFSIPQLPPLPQLPQFVIPQLPPLPQFPQFVIPQLPSLPQFPQFVIPQLPPLPPLPQFQIPQLPPLPSFPQFVIPQLPPLPPLPQFQIPQLPPLPQLPQIQVPQLPTLPSLPSTPVSAGTPPQQVPSLPSTPATPPQPKQCLSSLMQLMPCMEYLTQTSVAAPPSTCCSGFKSLVDKAPICLCHGINGNINKFTPAPIDFARMMSLPTTCGVTPPLQTLAQCSTGAVPPLMPSAAPSPGPSS
ncbi:hypothetical protein GUJ93_ZPchr0007g3588 [Zizania palustris]|uniref:Bifunctional inhibitor/plant lipid transfer protein/seed storage helical domain-containing protein n=1 Tax=Zizania palustris TaxID=103762 RepID=A0A8J5W6H0_ZIZPA|nr:hypothetical protein GUJ93_ZPchr0007g3588 [Zizania palustris]